MGQKYRAVAVLVNDDQEPSPESVRDIIAHSLRDEGLLSVTVESMPDEAVGPCSPQQEDRHVELQSSEESTEHDGLPHGDGVDGQP